MTQGTIDVITAVGREDKWLSKACESVARFAELVSIPVSHFLSSDGPEDDWIYSRTAPYSSQYYESIVVSKSSDQRLGPARTRNKALKMGVSEYVLTLDSDDLYVAEEMALLWRSMIHSEAAWAAGKMIEIDEDGKMWNFGPTVHLNDGWTARDCYRKHMKNLGYLPFHCTATICERVLLEEAGGWDTSKTFIRGEDIALWARITKKVPGWFSHRPVLQHRVHPEAITKSSVWRPEGYSLPDYLNNDLLDNPEASSGNFEEDLSSDSLLNS